MSDVLRTGDMLLTTVADGVVSTGIRWRLNSDFSHCVPILAPGFTIEVYTPKARVETLSYFRGRDFVALRLVDELTPGEANNFAKMALMLRGIKYDLKSFLGFIANQNIQDRKKLNCAEGTLLCYQAAGRFLEREIGRVSPQSFYEWYKGGIFRKLDVTIK